MLSSNRTFMMTMLCLLAMLLTSVTSGVGAAKLSIEIPPTQELRADLDHPLGVNKTDCLELHHSKHLIEKGQKTHTSCSSSCIVKIPTNLMQDDLMLLPFSLAPIDELPAPKAVVMIDKPYRPPIV